MNKTRKLIVGGVLALALGGTATGVAVASGAGDDAGETNSGPITGRAYDQAAAKALDVVGEGRVTETEAGDEESYYQVEVTKDDGSQVDVNLDRQFNVVKTTHETEREGADD